MNLSKEIEKIFEENKERLSVALVMDLVEEIEHFLTEEYARALEIEYEDVQAKFFGVKRKIRAQLEEQMERNAS